MSNPVSDEYITIIAKLTIKSTEIQIQPIVIPLKTNFVISLVQFLYKINKIIKFILFTLKSFIGNAFHGQSQNQ